MDTFSHGKHGKRLSEIEILVRNLNTWSTKTLIQRITNYGQVPESATNKQILIVQLAHTMIKHDKEQNTL